MVNKFLRKRIFDGFTPGIDITGLYAYYRFDDKASDRFGINNFTEHGAITYETGIVNKNIRFNGSNLTFIDITSSDFNFGNNVTDSPFSISGWLRYDTAGDAFIINRRTGANVSEYQLGQFSGALQFSMFSQGGASVFIGRKFATVPLVNTWYHFVITYDGSSLNTGINLYIDGVNNNGSTTGTGSYVAMKDTGIPMELGKALITSLPFDGKLDGLGWWNLELTPSRVLDIYNEQLTKDLK